ncbi:MAG: SLC13 family permease [Pseudonocardiaceae bacterium]
MTGAAAEVVALVLLAAVLVFAMVQPRGLPEATVAVPAAGLAVALGVVRPADALTQLRELGPTLGFLAAVLVLAHLAEVERVFRWLGDRLASVSGDRPRRLLLVVFASAAVTTAVLSLDATVMLLTPVVFGTTARLRLRAKPHVYACTHLANSASTLLPVSNLTNLLAFNASGLSFLGFAALMTGPWLASIAVEFLALRWFFATDLIGSTQAPGPPSLTEGHPHAAVRAHRHRGHPRRVRRLVIHRIPSVVMAGVGAAVLAGKALGRREVTAWRLVRAGSPLFCLFVLALGVVVAGVTAHGLGATLGAVLPSAPTLPGLLVVAGLAAALSNVVNNLPATLMLLGALGPAPYPGLVLAALLGVNIGPNLTYIGSLATLLWRRVLASRDAAPTLGEFSWLGTVTVPTCLAAATIALWLSLTLGQK